MEIKRAKVIMLPTEDKSAPILKYKGNNSLQYFPNTYWSNKDLIKQHLYITTDDKIKEGDWYISYGIERKSKTGEIVPKQIIKADLNKTNEFLIEPWSKYCKKIIATTDKSLVKEYQIHSITDEETIINLPQPSQAFIEKYCKVGGIDEVMVDYEQDYVDGFTEDRVRRFYGDLKLKVDSHNTITTHPIKEKTYSTIDLIGNQDVSLDTFLLNSSKFSQEDREMIMEAVYEWIKKHNNYGVI